jgi:hypothetical protein
MFWCLWGDMNYRTFEDRERSLGELLSLFFDTLYLWTAAFLLFCRLIIVISLFVLFFLIKCFFLNTFCILRGALCF